MKKLIFMILAVLYFLSGCNDATVDNNNSSNDVSEEISAEMSSESSESSEDSFETSESEDSSEVSESEESDIISESSEASDSSEESTEDISSEEKSSFEEPSEMESSEENREEDVTYIPENSEESSEEEKNDDVSSAPVAPPVSGGENGNESKPENNESKVEDVSSAPVESEVEDESKVDNPTGHTHNYTSLVYEPWCGIEGYTEYTCECGDIYKADYTAALTHDYGEWEVVETPSTIREGKQRRLCKICNKFEYESIPKIVVTITQEDLDYMAECALEMLNEQRIAAGLQPLVTGPVAHQMASERAVQLSEHFSHELPNGYIGSWEVFAKYKYNPESLDGDYMPELGGENIAKSTMSTEDGLTQDKQNHLRIKGRGLMGGFQLSIGHWGDLMRADYTACGVGVYAVRVSEDRFDTYICVLTMDKLYGSDATQ